MLPAPYQPGSAAAKPSNGGWDTRPRRGPRRSGHMSHYHINRGRPTDTRREPLPPAVALSPASQLRQNPSSQGCATATGWMRDRAQLSATPRGWIRDRVTEPPRYLR